jgi:hypothetical protein
MNERQRHNWFSGPLLEIETPTVGEDGLVPHDQWGKPLPIEIPNSERIVEGCTIELLVNSTGNGDKHTVLKEEAENPDFRFPFSLDLGDVSPPFGNPQIDLVLNYEVFIPATNVTISSPFTHTVKFDKQPPGSEPQPYIGFTVDQLDGVFPGDIVEGYFEGELAAWPKMAKGDTMTPWHGATAPDPGIPTSGLLTETQVIIGPDDVGRRVAVRFPQAALLALGNTAQHFGYQLKDKLGNTSNVSQTRAIEVHLNDAKARRSLKKAPALARAVRFRLADEELFPPVVTGLRPSDGTITLEALKSPIPVTFEIPPLPVSGAQAQLYANGYDTPQALGTPENVPDGVTTFTMNIEPQDFPADVYPYVDFKVDYLYGDPFGNSNFSYKPVTIRFDRSAPGGLPPKPGPIAFTEEQLEGIGQDDIDPAKQGLVVHIASWNLEDMDDQIELFLGSGPSEGNGSYLPDKPAPVTVIGSGVEAVFPLTELEKLTTNPVYFGYRITDWAGNVSQLSDLIPIDLFLNDVPSNLLAPLVPDAAPYNPPDGTGAPPSTGLLIWTEANPDTTVRIPVYDNVAAGDRIYLRWNGQALTPVIVQQQDIDDAPTNGFLLQISVLLSVIKTGANLPVNYDVYPANNGPVVTSPAQYVNVDLTTPGGPDPDPDPGTPEHDNMQPLSVMSTLAGSTENIIPPDAFELAANITIKRTGVDNQPIWLVGDVVKVYWGPNHGSDPITVTIDPTNQGTNLIIPLAAGFIKDNGTGAIDVYYTLTRDLGNGNLVTIPAFKTVVTVSSQGEAPGGLDPLAQAIFPEARPPVSANPYPFIRRAEGLNGTTLRIPLRDANNAPLANVGVGDTIEIEFYGVNDPQDGAGHDADPTKPTIPESVIKPAPYNIIQTDLDQGYYELALPYSKLYYICYNLSVTKYSIANSVAKKNAPDTYILFVLASPGVACTLP